MPIFTNARLRLVLMVLTLRDNSSAILPSNSPHNSRAEQDWVRPYYSSIIPDVILTLACTSSDAPWAFNTILCGLMLTVWARQTPPTTTTSKTPANNTLLLIVLMRK